MAYAYTFDPTGVNPSNLISNEQQVITGVNASPYHFIVPTFGPFFADSLVITFKDASNAVRPLVEGIDYHLGYLFVGASRACAKPIYGGISFLDLTLSGIVTLSYQTIGGEWTIDAAQILEILSDATRNPRTATWEQIAGVPTVFPPVDHQWNLDDMVGMSEVVQALADLTTAVSSNPSAGTSSSANLIPTPAQIGLGNVKNYKVATDVEATAGALATRYMTPRGVKLFVDSAITAFQSTFYPKYNSVSMPTSGTYNPGEYVKNTAPTLQVWSGLPLSLSGAKYVVKGWVRVTGGSNHVANVDWVEDRSIYG